MKKLIKSYNGLVFVKIGDSMVRKSSIESISEEDGVVWFRVTSGQLHSAEKADAKKIITELGFNE